MFENAKANVVVFMPPAVEAGEPPYPHQKEHKYHASCRDLG
jgi:hypothetical protein